MLLKEKHTLRGKGWYTKVNIKMNFKERNLYWDHGKHQNYFTDDKHKFTLAWHHKSRKSDSLNRKSYSVPEKCPNRNLLDAFKYFLKGWWAGFTRCFHMTVLLNLLITLCDSSLRIKAYFWWRDTLFYTTTLSTLLYLF